MKCKYCNSENLILKQDSFETDDILKANRVKLICANCGKFIKWCAKEDRKWYIQDFFKGTTMATSNGESDKFANNTFIEIPKIKKLLFVEDGSVDVDNLEDEMMDLGIKVIVYRNGGAMPKLIDLEEK